MTNPPDDYGDLGRALRVLRRKAGLTQEQAGAAAGIGNKHLSAVEKNHRGISWPTLCRLLRAYGVTLTDLDVEIERGKAA